MLIVKQQPARRISPSGMSAIDPQWTLGWQFNWATLTRCAAASVLSILLGGTWALASSPPSVFDTVNSIEKALYAKQYPQQPILTRLNRIETTLTGQVRPGGVPSRIQWLDCQVRQLDEQRMTALEHQRTLTFAEQRLLHQANPTASTPQRLEALEASLYGRPSNGGDATDVDQTQTLEARLGRLRQSLPLNVRRIGLQVLPAQTSHPMSLAPAAPFKSALPPPIPTPATPHRF
jgi:hypothetical protein